MRIEIADEVFKDRITKILLRDYHAWKPLQHENILPLLGFTMVSPWMHNGSLTTYLGRNFTELTSGRKFQIVCYFSTKNAYVIHRNLIHSNDVVHGDLTANNILIDLACNAHVADHGILAMCSELGGTSFIKSNVPENEDSLPPPKPESDIYSFGCIMLQVMTGPGRPSSPHIEDSFWDLIQKCWSDLGHYPSAVEVLSFLQSDVQV
ncbi:kinase-like protein [Rhizopogon salebrosus TDB-379]|nr:kinase-like protein [Rhizopogon salebrosus TDB-379]